MGRLSLLGLCLLPACKDATFFVPASAADVRTATQAAEAAKPRSVAMRDEHGVAHTVDTSTPLHLYSVQEIHNDYVRRLSELPRAAYELDLGQVGTLCSGQGPCPLDDATAKWEFGVTKRVPDGGQIAVDVLTPTLIVGLLTANFVCFGADACGTPAKVLVGVGDAALVTGIVVILELFIDALHKSYSD
jgi:hypothetical protein